MLPPSIHKHRITLIIIAAILIVVLALALFSGHPKQPTNHSESNPSILSIDNDLSKKTSEDGSITITDNAMEQRPASINNSAKVITEDDVKNSSAASVSNLPALPAKLDKCYTIQLTAARNLQTLENFIKQYHLSGPLAYFHSEFEGKDWYVLVYGHYRLEKTAKIALEELPAAIQEQHAWIRSFKDIQHAEKTEG